VDLAGQHIERLLRAGAAEIDDGLHQRTKQRAAIERAGDRALVRRLRDQRERDVVAVRGKFTAAFMLACLEAIGAKEIRLT
jgi:hypothetical protein